jgi:hypothetical protein
MKSISNKNKVVILITMIYLSFFAYKVSAQDIIIKSNKNRVITKVLIANDSLVKCKGYQSNNDTIFSINAKEIDLILFEKGNIKQYNNTSDLATNLVKKEQDSYVDTSIQNDVKSDISNPYKQPQPNNKKLNHTFDIGAGITAARLLNRVYANYDILPFQINLRYILTFKNPSAIGLGLNLNYTNLATIAVAKRYSVHGVGQIYLVKKQSFIIYLNGMAGFAVFDNYNVSNSGTFVGNNEVVLPSIHAGFGFKSFWSGSSGYFIETGIGGPYLINAGIFF